MFILTTKYFLLLFFKTDKHCKIWHRRIIKLLWDFKYTSWKRGKTFFILFQLFLECLMYFPIFLITQLWVLLIDIPDIVHLGRSIPAKLNEKKKKMFNNEKTIDHRCLLQIPRGVIISQLIGSLRQMTNSIVIQIILISKLKWRKRQKKTPL